MFKFGLKNILSKSKFVYLSGILLTTSVLCPLTSCGSDGSVNDIGGFDKEFGFDAQTYNRLENEFINKYKNQLLDDDNVDKVAAFDRFDNFLKNDIVSIRNQLFDPAQNYSFTIRTNALLDYAVRNHNIYLNRNTNVGEIEFANLEKSAKENFIIYLDNKYGVDDSKDKQEKIDNFSSRFNQLLSEAKNKHTDNAEILLRLRAGIIDCWQDLNQEFALLAACNHLNDFFDDYQFTVKDQSNKQTDDNKLLWDNLLNDDQFITNHKTGLIDQDIDCPISDQWINKLFTLSKKKNFTENNSINQHDDSAIDIFPGWKEIKRFDSQNIISGYTLTPVLKTMTQDIYTNNYYMNVDWQLISNKYKDETNQKIKDNVTAHLACNTDLTNDNQQFSSDNYDFANYQLLSTPTYEFNNLKKAYFTSSKPGENIVFSWDQDKTPLEQFFPDDVSYDNDEPMIIDEQYRLAMTEDNLSNACLKVNNEFLSNLLIVEDKVPHSLDNIPTVDENTSDDETTTSSIEEKFVNYCNITSATTNVTFHNITKNEITTSFNISYANSNLVFDNIANDAEISDVKLSDTFCDDAVGCYRDVNNYVDTKEITEKGKKAVIHSKFVKIWLIMVIVMLFTTIVLISTKLCLSKKLGSVSNATNNTGIFLLVDKHPLIIFGVLLALAVILSVTWCCYIDNPINERVEAIKKWNNALKKDITIDDLHILKKIEQDKEYFSSTSNFQKYFDTNRSQAYASYWYYLHFNNLINDPTNENTKEIIDDYNAFCNKREEYLNLNKSSKNAFKISFYFLFVVVFILTFIFLVIVACIFYETYEEYQIRKQATQVKETIANIQTDDTNLIDDQKQSGNEQPQNENVQPSKEHQQQQKEKLEPYKEKKEIVKTKPEEDYDKFLEYLKKKYKDNPDIDWDDKESDDYFLNHIKGSDRSTYESYRRIAIASKKNTNSIWNQYGEDWTD